jgi:hypothetical protein
MPMGRPFRSAPHSPLEIPSHSAVSRRCRGTATATRTISCSPARTRYLRGLPTLAGEADCPSMVVTNITLGGGGDGHDAPGGHRGGEEHPAAAMTPAASSPATRVVRTTGITLPV